MAVSPNSSSGVQVESIGAPTACPATPGRRQALYLPCAFSMATVRASLKAALVTDAPETASTPGSCDARASSTRVGRAASPIPFVSLCFVTWMSVIAPPETVISMESCPPMPLLEEPA